MKRLFLCGFLLMNCLFSWNVSADITDSPSERIDKYWKNMCVARHTNSCVTEVCMYSSERHCHQTCSEAAYDICREELGY